VLGDAALLRRHDDAIAIVGTRRMSHYGERATRTLAGPLAGAGGLVLSGMALGVDGVAHTVALDVGAATVAVLGTGVDLPYPAAHRGLYRRIAERGAVVSEQLPGATGAAGAFPRRNRIIAALSGATLVVEAGHTSGALITAGIALDLGRTVAAVPGPIDSERSAGCNRLLRDGATVVADPDDALALVGLPPRRDDATPAAAGLPPVELGDDQLAVWRALATPAPDVDALAATTDLPARRCITAVAMLEVAGLVETAFDGTLRRRS
jgi:DNA processing protein